MDYVGPDIPSEELRQSVTARTKESMRRFARVSKVVFGRREKEVVRDRDVEKSDVKSGVEREGSSAEKEKEGREEKEGGEKGSETRTENDQPLPSPPPPTATPLSLSARATPPRIRVMSKLRAFLLSFFNPPTASIIAAFPISLIPTLKALFVPGVAGTHIPNAPDGQPPLAFILDAASFIGAASVPLGLICLGSALARLKVPKRDSGGWNKLPMGAIWSLAVVKMIAIPVLGVVVCQGLAKVGFIDPEDKVLRFVCMYVFCLCLSSPPPLF